jgi:hypothetical protein
MTGYEECDINFSPSWIFLQSQYHMQSQITVLFAVYVTTLSVVHVTSDDGLISELCFGKNVQETVMA